MTVADQQTLLTLAALLRAGLMEPTPVGLCDIERMVAVLGRRLAPRP